MSGTYKFGDRSEGIRILQQALADNGFNPGAVDSVYGPATLNAINDARAAYRLDGINRVDADLLQALGILPKPPKGNIVTNWFNSFVTTTAFKYLVAMAATYIATKLGLEKGSVEGILTQLIAVAMGIWGAWESSRSKIVVDGKKVSVSDLSANDKAVVRDIVALNR